MLQAYIVFVAGLFGLIIGSFLNACAFASPASSLLSQSADGSTGGCANGVCLDQLVLWQADFLPGGVADMKSGDRDGACVLPGWVEPGTTSGNSKDLFVGFEP